MCGSLGCSLRSLPALVPTWCIRNTSTCAHSSLAKGDFVCAGFASCHPARWILFVTPSSSSLAPLGLGPCVGCSTYVLIQSFFHQIPVTAFTTTSFTCWLPPPSSYPWQFSRLFLRTGDHSLINCVFISFVLLWI